jgi:hypothetical protein
MDSEDYVFISYSRHDKSIAEKLTKALQERGVHVWRDVEEIQPGSSWWAEIDKGIKGASAVICVVSQDATDSYFVSRGVEVFLSQGKPIIPVVTDDTAMAIMPLSLKRFQWLDLRHGFDLVVDHIVEALRGEVTIGAPVQKKAQQSKGYVFISYAEEDSDFVEQLKLFMKDRGYAYWDYEESDRDYHSQLFLELESVIKEAAATLSVLSEAWKRSKWTVKEYFFSEEIGIPVFLLRAKQIGPTLAIAGIPYIDFVPDIQRGFAKLDKELKRKKL